MDYHHCPNCGQKALSVATRCPRCGLPFETQFLGHQAPGSKRSRMPLALLVTGTVAALLVANALLQRPGVIPPVSPPATAIDSAPPPASLPQSPTESLGPAADSVRTAPSPPSRLPNESPAPAADSAGLAAPNRTTEPVATAAAQRRYASTWMNVRAYPSSAAPVIRILRPGEVVLVDSLERGWYRVVTDRQALGYVDRRYLDTSPPQTPP